MVLAGCVLILVTLCYLSVRQSTELPEDSLGGEDLEGLVDSLSMLGDDQPINQDTFPYEKKGERNHIKRQ